MSVIHKIFDYNRRYGLRYTVCKVCRRFGLKYIWGQRKYPFSLSEMERKKQGEESLAFIHPPLISIIVPLFHTPEKYLREMLDSVLRQTYPHWELCLADASGDDSLAEIVREYRKKAEQQMNFDGVQEKNRVKYLYLGKNGGIAENSNAAAKMAEGEYIALLDHDDLLHPAALYEVAKVICQKKADFIYTDELTFVKKPSVVQSVHLKSDFRWEHIRSNNYICHFSVFLGELFWKVGGFQKEYDGAQDYDLFLKMAEECEEICHIPKVLYYWRLHGGSSAAGVETKPYVVEAGRRAVEQHLRRAGISASVRETEFGSFYRVRYHVSEGSRVLLLAENEETAEWLREELTDCPYVVEVWCRQARYVEDSRRRFVAADVGCVGKKGPHTRGKTWSDRQDGNGEHDGEVALDYGCNTMDYVVLVRKGYCPIHNGYGWLTELLGGLQWWEHRLAGALIYNRKEQVEHAGFYCDLRHSQEVYFRYQGVPRAENGYMNHLRFNRVVDYLYGAVLAMRWEDFGQDFQKRAEEEWERIFTREAWFSLCGKIKEQGRYSVLTVQEPWIEK